MDVGQTVAASLSAPKLFVIANDLSRMQILASVDESDIGLVREGLPVTFTVQSYRGVTFEGTVRQVRLNSTTDVPAAISGWCPYRRRRRLSRSP